jgi:hypothetical protein
LIITVFLLFSISLLLLPLWSIGLISQFFYHFTDGRTPWTGHQLVARPLPKHRITQTQNKHIHIPNIHALCGIRASERVKTVHALDRSATVTGYFSAYFPYFEKVKVALRDHNSVCMLLGNGSVNLSLRQLIYAITEEFRVIPFLQLTRQRT